MRAVTKSLILMGIGGLLYLGIEMLWRGHTHWTMFFVGGICFLVVGGVISYDMPLCRQMLLSAFIVTAVELEAGIILNGICWLNVWDYSNLPFNFLGQICLQYTCLWFLISLPAILLDDYLRYLLFGEERPHYRII